MKNINNNVIAKCVTKIIKRFRLKTKQKKFLFKEFDDSNKKRLRRLIVIIYV